MICTHTCHKIKILYGIESKFTYIVTSLPVNQADEVKELTVIEFNLLGIQCIKSET